MPKKNKHSSSILLFTIIAILIISALIYATSNIKCYIVSTSNQQPQQTKFNPFKLPENCTIYVTLNISCGRNYPCYDANVYIYNGSKKKLRIPTWFSPVHLLKSYGKCIPYGNYTVIIADQPCFHKIEKTIEFNNRSIYIEEEMEMCESCKVCDDYLWT